MIEVTVNEYLVGFAASVIANSLSALADGVSGLFLLPALLFLSTPFLWHHIKLPPWGWESVHLCGIAQMKF
jgi:hypothetical protein